MQDLPIEVVQLIFARVNRNAIFPLLFVSKTIRNMFRGKTSIRKVRQAFGVGRKLTLSELED